MLFNSLNMLLLFFIHAISCLELHEWQNFAIQFNQSCENYLVLHNNETNEFIKLDSDGEHLSLYTFKNQSWTVFSAPLQTNFVFHWPDVTVNSIKMTSEDNFTLPLNFNYNEINCHFIGLAVGTLMEQTLNAECEIYQCPETKVSDLKILLLCAIFVLGCLLSVILYKLSEKILSERTGKRKNCRVR